MLNAGLHQVDVDSMARFHVFTARLTADRSWWVCAHRQVPWNSSSPMSPKRLQTSVSCGCYGCYHSRFFLFFLCFSPGHRYALYNQKITQWIDRGDIYSKPTEGCAPCRLTASSGVGAPYKFPDLRAVNPFKLGMAQKIFIFLTQYPDNWSIINYPENGWFGRIDQIQGVVAQFWAVANNWLQLALDFWHVITFLT